MENVKIILLGTIKNNYEFFDEVAYFLMNKNNIFNIIFN